MIKLTVFFLILLFSPISVSEISTRIDIALFSTGNMAEWSSNSFANTTDYQLVLIDNKQVLRAISNGDASGLFKEQKIDLQKTPFLNWSWRIDNHLENNNEQIKSGDDYSARIYVIINGGLAFWKTKALNYVWANASPKGSVWPNAFAGTNAMMIAVRTGTDETHSWYQEKRNILQDLKQQFGSDIRYIDAIAIMTDTDNTKGSTTAYFGDIFFTEH